MESITLRSRRSIIIEYALAVLAAAILVIVVDLFTNDTPPRWDALQYVDMAENGIFGNDNLAAPFAYRPGMPSMVALVSRTAGISTNDAFRAVGYLFMITTLTCTYGIAKSFTENKAKAALPAILVGLAAAQVKFPLFFYSLVDVSGYAFMAGAVWALLKEKKLLGLAISLVGLLFKEFLAGPLLWAIFLYWNEHRQAGTKATLASFVGAATAGAAFIIVPRLVIPIAVSVQEFDPINHPRSMIKLLTNPLDWRRDLNIIYSFMGVWLPALILMSAERARSIWQHLVKHRAGVIIVMGVIALLTMYGGQNIPIFASYSFALHVIILALLLKNGVSVVEIIYVILATVVVNKTFLPIPQPDTNLSGYLNFYGGYDNVITLETLRRAALMIAMILGGILLRRLPIKDS
ncbi:MAG: hypothetical protein OEV06_06920 [Anaerolineae bacterium]|nr:hypothetical protein [Anaerolineae bacterium]